MPIQTRMFLSSFCLLLLFHTGAMGQASLKERVLTALNDGATYASTVILDEKGVSRCDYNMTEGKWYPYEEPWHTGQIIYGLLEANRITGKPEYLESARRAGDWWTGLEITDQPKLNGMLRAIHGDDAGEVIVFATVSDGTQWSLAPMTRKLVPFTRASIFGMLNR